MFKLNIPMTIVLSSGSLMLLALGSLLLASNTAYTSNIQAPEGQLVNREPEIQGTPIPFVAALYSPSNSTQQNEVKNSTNQSPPVDKRRRGGRLYGSQSSSAYGQSQQQATLDSYAAAYGAAAAPTASDQIGQSTAQANDASSYASFGEPAPSVASPQSTSSSIARQLAASDYVMPHSAYYAGYMSPSSSSASYAGQQSSPSSSGSQYHSQAHAYPSYHYHKSAPQMVPAGYPTNAYDRHSSSALASGYHDRAAYLGAASNPFWASSSVPSGLMSSASSALSHWTGGFTITEIICTVIAISIGAIILGAPFFLIYLALMGNFSGSGTLSLTNPTQGAAAAGGTPANGRRKRLAIFEEFNSPRVDHKHMKEFGAFADALVSRLSPLVDLQQVSASFKRLVDSIEKHSHLGPEKGAKNKST